MPISPRDGVWHAHGYYWDDRGAKRRRWRRSTGIADDGTKRAERLAEQVAHQIAQSYATGAVRRARPLTLTAAIDIHLAAHELAQSSASTIEIVSEKAERLIDFFGAGYDCDALENASLVKYATHRLKQPGARRGSTLSPGTVYRELRTLREALGDAKRLRKFDGAIPDMPDLGQIYKPRERWLDTAETKRLLLAVPPQWRDHVVMYRQHGLDESELYRVERSAIDWVGRELRVYGTKTHARMRTLPLTDETLEILQRRAALPGPLFERWDHNNTVLARACVKAGIEHCCLKDLRRSFATELAIAGVSMLYLQKLMGHASGRMLEQVYARVERGQHMHDAMAKLAPLRPAQAAQRHGTGEDS